MPSGFLGSGIGPTAIKRRAGLAAPVPVAGAELLVNGNMETGNPPSSWTAQRDAALSAVAERTGGAGAQALRVAYTVMITPEAAQTTTHANHTWMQISAWSRRITTGSAYIVFNGGQAIPTSSDSWVQGLAILRATSANQTCQMRASTTGAAEFDDVSWKPLTLSSLLSTLAYASADCDLSVGVTRTAGTQAGLCARLDSATTPANFLIAYLDGAGNVKVDKCVAGTYTNVISGAVTYVAGQVLRLVCAGNNVSVYYNGVQVGSTTAVADAGITGNTRHGLFSTYAANTFAGYTAA